MPVNKEKLTVAEVTVGMYVCELDRPWLETPFLIQGLLVDNDSDLHTLARHCEYVYVDRSRSRDDAVFPERRAAGTLTGFPRQTSRSRAPQPVSRKQIERQQKVLKLLDGREQLSYRDAVSWRQEMAAARQAVNELNGEVRRFFESLSHGSTYSLAKLKLAVTPLISSIERNPDACMWLARLSSRDSDLHRHGVATAIWALALGRELGLSPRDLKTLALGALLLDIGLLRIGLLDMSERDRDSSDPVKPSFAANPMRKAGASRSAESALLRSHVDEGLKLLDESPVGNPEIRDMIACHHERYDGSGYPRGLKGERIPLFARIATIADGYDAMTSEQPYGEGLSPSFAIKQLYRRRGRDYDGVLVEEFIQAVGLYPAGTLVLLSSGEVGMVVAEGRSRRLKPQVLLVLDPAKRPYQRLRLINLMNASCADTGSPLEIIQSLEPGSYGVEPARIPLDQVQGA